MWAENEKNRLGVPRGKLQSPRLRADPPSQKAENRAKLWAKGKNVGANKVNLASKKTKRKRAGHAPHFLENNQNEKQRKSWSPLAKRTR